MCTIPISTHNSRGPGDGTLASQALSHLFDADFCSGSVWELSWGANSLLTASAESVSNPLNHSLASKYEFVLWGNGISTFPTCELTSLCALHTHSNIQID